MSADMAPRAQYLHQVGAPSEVHPTSGWSISTSGDPVSPDINDQFGTLPIPSDAGTRAAHINLVWALDLGFQ